jgi:hypothetical protein
MDCSQLASLCTPRPMDTVLLVSTVQPTAIKEALLAQAILSAPQLPVVVLLDGTQEDYQRYSDVINKRWRHRSPYLATVHAPKSTLYVAPSSCPGKLEAAEWCAASGYKFCWHMEDDVYVHNMSALELAYRNSTIDLLTHGLHTGHPFWVSAPPGAHSGLGWNNRSHLLLHAPVDTPRFFALAIYRMSRAFAQSLTRTVLDEGKLSMCEIWYPYLIYTHSHLTGASMLREHLPSAMNLNFGQPCHLIQGLHEVRARHDFMAHPVRDFKRVSTPNGTETRAQCLARAQRENANSVAREGQDSWATRAPRSPSGGSSSSAHPLPTSAPTTSPPDGSSRSVHLYPPPGWMEQRYVGGKSYLPPPDLRALGAMGQPTLEAAWREHTRNLTHAKSTGVLWHTAIPWG